MNSFLVALIFALVLVVPADAQVDHLYKIEKSIMSGDKQAIAKMGAFLDSRKKVIEYLGYHRIETTESAVARRIIEENTLFTLEEINVGSVSKAEFLAFFKRRAKEIVFSKTLDAFLITPIERRDYVAHVYVVEPHVMKQVEGRTAKLLQEGFLSDIGVEPGYLLRDPKVLFNIAAALYRKRNRYNVYYFHREKYFDLLRHLTGIELQVANNEGELTLRPENDYGDATIFNVVAFFARNFGMFRWSESLQRFDAPMLKSNQRTNVQQLAADTYGDDSAAAVDAFSKLIEMPEVDVREALKDFSRLNPPSGSGLPMFTDRFAIGLARLTAYCRANGIRYRPRTDMHALFDRLLDDTLSFGDRYRLENEIISSMKTDDLTSFEVFAAVNSSSWDLTYSAGRIVDIFYSRNWNALTSGDAELRLNLTKASTFGEFGIIGNCGNYEKKFATTEFPNAATVSRTAGRDPRLLKVAAEIAKQRAMPSPSFGPGKWDAEMASVRRADLGARLDALIADSPNMTEKEENEAVDLISNASFDQIGVALDFLERAKFAKRKGQFGFVSEDFGFELAGDFGEPEVRRTFRALLEKHDEESLHRYFLDREGIVYKTSSGELDLDAIYEMLRFDVVSAFAGGGGGTRDANVYPLVKLLEKRFGTTHGFPDKRCRSRITYGCNPKSRARTWMVFLKKQRLLKKQHTGPESFSYVDD